MNPDYYGKEKNCFIGVSAVTHHERLSDPISEANYYKYFEYTDRLLNELVDFQNACTQYVKDYTSDMNAAICSVSICSSRMLLLKCEQCVQYIIPKCRDCSIGVDRASCNKRTEKRHKEHCLSLCSYTALLKLSLALAPNYACPDDKTESPCSKCRYLAESSNLPSDRRKITVHDIRLFGHPLQVCIDYDYHRCKRKQEYLAHFPGISEQSGFNQIRFSVRLTERINAAILERVPLNYISEASAVPYDTIRRWKSREEHIAERRISKQKYITHFSDSFVLETQCLDIQFSSYSFKLCLQACENGTEVSGLYPREEWEALDQLMRTGKDENMILRKFNNMNGGCYILYNMVFDYLCENSRIPEPAIGSYVVTNVIMRYLDNGFLPVEDLPIAYRDYLKNIWDYFQSDVLDESMKKNDSRLLRFLPALAFFSLSWMSEDVERSFLEWEGISSSDAFALKPRPASAFHQNLTNQQEEIELLAENVEVAEDEIPLLLLYFNPMIFEVRNSNYQSNYDNTLSSNFARKFYFGINGEFDYDELFYYKRPFISLDHFVKCLKAGILMTPDPLIIPLSEKIQPAE